jgi:hypothetical protein
MLFCVLCRDKPRALALRKVTRDAHLAWIETLGERVRGAGPMLDDAGAPVGSILFIEAESRAHLDALIADDPYARAGLFAQVDATAFSWTVQPKPVEPSS